MSNTYFVYVSWNDLFCKMFTNFRKARKYAIELSRSGYIGGKVTIYKDNPGGTAWQQMYLTLVSSYEIK